MKRKMFLKKVKSIQDGLVVDNLYLCNVGHNCLAGTGKYSYSYKIYKTSIRIRKQNSYDFRDVYVFFDGHESSEQIKNKLIEEMKQRAF